MLVTIMLLSTCPPKNSFKKQIERRRFRFKTWKLPILRDKFVPFEVQPALDTLKEASLPETAEIQSVSLEIFQD